MAANKFRAQFADTAVNTAPKERLVTMCYDRLLRDLREAGDALEHGPIEVAHARLIHAQDLLAELDRALDVSAWPGARDLHRLYDYVRDQLLTANLRKDARAARNCVLVLEPLAAAWHEAYRLAGATAAVS